MNGDSQQGHRHCSEQALAVLVLVWWENRSQKELHDAGSGRVNPGELSIYSTDEETEAEKRDMVAMLYNI